MGNKYVPYPTVALTDRQWPNRTITKAPTWCSVDLRDGNQALPQPMNVEEKLELFQLLLEVGFKEIEVGFPSASDTEYRFIRRLIEEDRIPEDVTIQVLVQAREHLIARTFESLQGAKRAIVHLYNSTAETQRRIVFGKDRAEIIDIAVEGARLFNEYKAKYPDTDWYFEYSPESFSGTELDYALEICEAVLDVWEPTPERPVIINLPNTVEYCTPNVYADRIEWFHRNVKRRDSIVLSLHTHNDRGTGVASSELGLLAGADRLEGTLFGNGERTGNLDILTTALNMYTQGVDPELDFSNMNHLIDVYKKVTKLTVHERHPYAGELVYTAFSGSHQDAIRKGFIAQKESETGVWEVPYLPIDPQDVGRTYEEIIRINSQSGKGGAAYIMEEEFGFYLPKAMHTEFGAIVKQASDTRGDELANADIFALFEANYLKAVGPYAV
ncbi:MAG: 2-isopropylmalate synthase, partial [Bacilli bacterium]